MHPHPFDPARCEWDAIHQQQESVRAYHAWATSQRAGRQMITEPAGQSVEEQPQNSPRASNERAARLLLLHSHRRC